MYPLAISNRWDAFAACLQGRKKCSQLKPNSGAASDTSGAASDTSGTALLTNSKTFSKTRSFDAWLRHASPQLVVEAHERLVSEIMMMRLYQLGHFP